MPPSPPPSPAVALMLPVQREEEVVHEESLFPPPRGENEAGSFQLGWLKVGWFPFIVLIVKSCELESDKLGDCWAWRCILLEIPSLQTEVDGFHLRRHLQVVVEQEIQPLEEAQNWHKLNPINGNCSGSVQFNGWTGYELSWFSMSIFLSAFVLQDTFEINTSTPFAKLIAYEGREGHQLPIAMVVYPEPWRCCWALPPMFHPQRHRRNCCWKHVEPKTTSWRVSRWELLPWWQVTWQDLSWIPVISNGLSCLSDTTPETGTSSWPRFVLFLIQFRSWWIRHWRAWAYYKWDGSSSVTRKQNCTLFLAICN